MQLQPNAAARPALRRAAAAAFSLLRRTFRTDTVVSYPTTAAGRSLTPSVCLLTTTSSYSSSGRIPASRLGVGQMAEPSAKRAKLDSEVCDGAMDGQSPAAAAPTTAEAAAAAGSAEASTPSPGRRRRRPLSPAPGKRKPQSGATATTTPPAAAEAKAKAKDEPEPVEQAPTATAAAAAAAGTAAQQAGRDRTTTAEAPAAAADGSAVNGAGGNAQTTAPAQQQQQEQQQQQHNQDQGKQQQQQQQHQAVAAAGQPQQQQPQRQQQQQQQQAGKKAKGKNKQRVPYLGTFHQCVKRELPYEAVHVYNKIKEAQGGKLDLALCNGLLNVAVGNWQWELHQRHQHLLRQYKAQGQDPAPLQAACDVYLAAQRERNLAPQEDQDGAPVQVDTVVPPGTPAAMVCHIVRADPDRSCPPEDLKNTAGLPDIQVLDDMPSERKPFTQLLSDVLELVGSDLEAAGVQPDEQLLMGLARVAGIMGDPDKAWEYARQVVAARGSRAVVPRLRDFHPALVGFALTGQADKAAEVVADMMQHCTPSDLTESELALWLEAIAAGGTYEQLVDALQVIAGELNELKPSTLALVQRFFESDRAAAALASGGPVACSAPSTWQLQQVVPDEQGHVAAAGATLALSDLSDADWQLFDQQVFTLGKRAESSSGQYEAFRSWLDKHGPFDITIDGANLAFFGENYIGGGFKCWKVRVAYERLQQQHPTAKILVVLHESRQQQTRKEDAETYHWLQGLHQEDLLYITPRNMNDDLFWMYAPIRGRAASRLVSNDKMRDHVWSMLRPKHMLKWKARHVITYDFSFDKTQFYPKEPRPYTPCVQQVRPGVWLLPSTQDGKWLLCKPTSG